MKLNCIGNVSSEMGPLLIADASTARLWRGSDGDGADYKLACDLTLETPAAFIAIGDQRAVVWEMEAPGMAEVFADLLSRLILVHCWLDAMDEQDEEAMVARLAALPIKQSTELGRLEITSGVLAILWAPEGGEGIPLTITAEVERPGPSLAIETAGLLVKLPIGTYSCLHDAVEIGENEAVRLHCTRI